MTRQTSIVTAHAARKLIESFHAAEGRGAIRRDFKCSLGTYVLWMRRCFIGSKPSGGVVVGLDDRRNWEHRSASRIPRTVRLKPGWTDLQARYAIERLIYAAAAEAPLMWARGAVFVVAECQRKAAFSVSEANGEAWIARAEAFAASNDLPLIYDKMSIDQCERWQEWLRSFD